MRRYCLTLLVALVVAGGIAFLVVWFRPVPELPPPLHLPMIWEIETVTAEVLNNEAGLKKVPRFKLPEAYYPAVLGAMSPYRQLNFGVLPDEQPLALVDIRTKTGQVTQLKIWPQGQNPICFMIDGVRYNRVGPYKSQYQNDDAYIDEGGTLAWLLADIGNEQTTGQRHTDRHIAVEILERSRGARPQSTR